MAHHPPPYLPNLQERHRPLSRPQWRQLVIWFSFNLGARTTRDPRSISRRRRRRRPRASRSPHKRRSQCSWSRYQQGHGSRRGSGERKGSVNDFGQGCVRPARHIGISPCAKVHSKIRRFRLFGLLSLRFGALVLWCSLGLGSGKLGRVDRAAWEGRISRYHGKKPFEIYNTPLLGKCTGLLWC